MTTTIQPYCAPSVFNPPTYTQAVKVTGAQTILFIAGQVAYDAQGKPAHRGDSPPRRARCSRRSRPRWRRAAAPSPTW
jgi:hypothetical protein